MSKPGKKYNFNGEMLTINDAIKKYNCSLSYQTVYNRIKSGIDTYTAITMKKLHSKRIKHKYNFNGKIMSLKEASNTLEPHVPNMTIYKRIQKGIDPYRAATNLDLPELKRGKSPKKYNFNGEMLTMYEAIDKYNPSLSYSKLYHRIHDMKMDPYKAVIYKYEKGNN